MSEREKEMFYSIQRRKPLCVDAVVPLPPPSAAPPPTQLMMASLLAANATELSRQLAV